jgi:hypothetical protein
MPTHRYKPNPTQLHATSSDKCIGGQYVKWAHQIQPIVAMGRSCQCFTNKESTILPLANNVHNFYDITTTRVRNSCIIRRGGIELRTG